MSFPGINPVTELISDHHKPVLQEIKIEDMINTGVKRGFLTSIYRNHRQLVLANSKRYFYDYFMICCGPFSLSTRVKYPDQMVAAFKSDGRLTSDG